MRQSVSDCVQLKEHGLDRLRLSVALSVEAARCWSQQRREILACQGMSAEAEALKQEFTPCGLSSQVLLAPLCQG